MKKLKDLFKGIDCRISNVPPDFEAQGISSDSTAVKKGEIFFAITGPERDGRDFINDAIQKGAAAVCAEDPIKVPSGTGVILVKDTMRTFSILASRVFDEPSKFLRVIGITGTNGKTTTAYLLYEMLKEAKKTPSLLGTVAYKINDRTIKSSNTTPGPFLLHSLLRRMKDEGGDYVVMEVSSHALKQARALGVDFKAAVMTNVTGDHLDYHGTMEDYKRSKRILFEGLGKGSVAILNKDDRFYGYFRSASKARMLDYGIKKKADFTAKDIQSGIGGSSFLMETPAGAVRINTTLIGKHNVYNILAAACACFAEDIGMDAVAGALKRPILVPGRLEPVDTRQRFKIFIDYAHTHDALEKVLSEIRPLCAGCLTVVFGCGGDRDKTKRPKMGRIAAEIADKVIITSDNPRGENPEAILDDIESGIGKGNKKYQRIADRFAAIKSALSGRGEGDVVVIAGKGHEDCQIIGKKVFPFSDRDAVEKILRSDDVYRR